MGERSRYRSGYNEAISNGREIVTRPDELRGRRIILGDASTSIANFRASEGLNALIAANRLGNEAEDLLTFVVGGGAACLALSDCGIDEEGNIEHQLERTGLYKELFEKLVKLDERAEPFFPPRAVVVLPEAIPLDSLLLQIRDKTIRSVGEEIGVSRERLDRVRVLPFSDLFPPELRVGEILLQQEATPGKVVLKFICPDCSRQQEEPIEHGITPEGEVVKPRGGRKIRCKGARCVREALEDGRLGRVTLAEAIENGFYLSGRAIYDLLCESSESDPDGAPALLVRNYSNPRNTLARIAERYPGPLGITRRYYLPDKKEVPGCKLPEIVSPATQKFVLEDDYLLSRDEGDVIIPIGSDKK